MSEQVLKEVTSKMYRKQLWVAITRAVTSREEIIASIEPHLRHQIATEKSGALFGAGSLTAPGIEGGTLGLIILRAADEAAARRILDADPMHAAGLRCYDLYRWSMNEGRINVSIDLSDCSFRFD